MENFGQHLIVGINGTSLSSVGKVMLEKVQPGGIILFESNIESKSQVENLISEIKKIVKIPPFITLDQEGGQVDRLRKITTSVPSLWGLSKVGIEEVLIAQKKIIHDLLELGFNMNLAPVLDINSNPLNPIIGTRSISNKVEIVSDFGVKISKFYLENGIIPVVKHFPGHGDLDIDSHLDLPILNKSLSELNKMELVPFKAAIENNLPCIMVGHIHVPSLDNRKNIPASISKKIITDLLRSNLGFNGLVITDDLTMKGLTNNFDLLEATTEAISAGADLVILASAEYIKRTDYEDLVIDAFERISQKSKSDIEFKKIIDGSCERIITHKNNLLKENTQETTPPTDDELKVIAHKVVSLIKKDLFFFPYDKDTPIEILYPITPKLFKDDLKKITSNLGLKTNLIGYTLNPTSKEILSIINSLIKQDKKILITFDASFRKKQKELAEALLKIDPGLMVISIGMDHDIEFIPDIKNFIAAYSPNQISLQAAFEKITR